MGPPLPTGTVTFLLTDIEGSTELLKLLGGDRYHDLLVDHQRLLRAEFEKAGGREIDSQGDAFFVAFQKARDAVMAAVTGQRALSAHDCPEGVKVQVRMGLDTGEPTVGQDRYVGLGVHRTARIMAAGHGGQVLLSGGTRELVADELPPEISLRDLGPQRLKDLDRPVHLFQVVAPGLPAKFPRLRTLDAGLRSRLLRRRVVLPAIAGLAGAAAAVILLVGQSGDSGLVVPANSVGVIDPKQGKVVAQIPVGVRPGAIDVGGGSVWVANQDDKTLSRIDISTRTVGRNIRLRATPTGVAAGKDAVWVAEGAIGSVERVSPVYNQVTNRIPGLAGPVRVSGGPRGSVAVGGGSVWTVFGSTPVARIDPVRRRGHIVGYAGFAASAIAYGEGALWIANETDNTVTQFSPITDAKVGDVNVGRSPSGVAVGGGAIWVADTGDDAVSRIDARTRSVTTIPVGHAPVGIAYGESGVWVANSGDGSVSRIDPHSGKVVRTIKVGGKPNGVAAAGGAVWVTVDAA